MTELGTHVLAFWQEGVLPPSGRRVRVNQQGATGELREGGTKAGGSGEDRA